jgi:hypothetical protein
MQATVRCRTAYSIFSNSQKHPARQFTGYAIHVRAAKKEWKCRKFLSVNFFGG